MKSSKRRTTSKSGSSASSTTKADSSQHTTASANAPASFEQVFGRGDPPKVATCKARLAEAITRLNQARSTPPAATAPRLFKTRYTQRLWRLEQAVEDWKKVIQHLQHLEKN